ncbi:Otolin 1a [Mactra antiquata]
MSVIINDGDSFNNNTGIFKCPEAGVYLFSFFLGQKGSGETAVQMWADLIVNSNVIVGGTVEARHPQQDLQGGNMAVVRLSLGDVVYLQASYSGDHVEGSTLHRFTTFTGVYLYA